MRRPRRRPVLLLALFLAPTCPQQLYTSPADSGDALGQCGQANEALKYDEPIMVCIGFEPQDSGTAGQPGSKAVFYPKVDQYSALAVSSLAAAVSSGNSATIKPYSHMWIGLQGKRTVGQRDGLVDADGNCALPNANSTDQTCYGWSLHNKPVVTLDQMLITGATVIVHLDRGEVNRIVWDNGCNLCPATQDTLVCQDDNTSAVCLSSSYGGVPVSCTDCYVPLDDCSGGPCVPKVHIAWVGTDREGVPLTSAGSILSRFREYSLLPVYNSLYREVAELSS